jgi:hypothetical protein
MMATIMSGGGAMGGPNGGDRRCDAKCHTATEPECDCICGGAYHGCGSSAVAQERLTEEWLGPDWRERYGQIAQQPVQQSLLGGAA